MGGAQVIQKQAELRLWRAMLRETDSELRKAFATRDRAAVRLLERDSLTIRSYVGSLHATNSAVTRAV